MDRQVGGVHLATGGDRGTLGDRIVDQRLHPREIGLVDDLGDAGLPDRAIVAIKIARHVGLEARHQPVALVASHEHIVGADAGLAAVELLGRCEVGGDLVDVGAFVDDDRRLAAQFQRHARQVLGGGGHDQFAHPRAAGEKDVAERQFEQRRRDADVTLEQRDLVFIERGAQDAAGDACGGRAQVGQLDHAAVARGNRRRDRAEREAQREIPRPQDQAHAARFVADLRGVVRVERGRDLGRRHPGIEVVDVALDIADDIQHFGDADFAFGLAGILQHRRDDGVGMGFDRGLEPRQFGLALLGRRGLHIPLMRLLQGKQPHHIIRAGEDVWRGTGHGVQACDGNRKRPPCKASTRAGTRTKARGSFDKDPGFTLRQRAGCGTKALEVRIAHRYWRRTRSNAGRGPMAEWLRTGLQIRLRRFDSGSGLHTVCLIKPGTWTRSHGRAMSDPPCSRRAVLPTIQRRQSGKPRLAAPGPRGPWCT